MQKETSFICPDAGSAKTRPWKAEVGDSFLPALGLWHPLGPFGNPRPPSPAHFLHGAGRLCRNVALGAQLGPPWPAFKIQNRLWHVKRVPWGLQFLFRIQAPYNTKPHARTAKSFSRDAWISLSGRNGSSVFFIFECFEWAWGPWKRGCPMETQQDKLMSWDWGFYSWLSHRFALISRQPLGNPVLLAKEKGEPFIHPV